MAVHAYHGDGFMQKKILAKYECPDKKPEDVYHPTMHIPLHLVPHGFNALTDSVKYDFTNEDTLLRRVQKKLNDKDIKRRIKRNDILFDISAALIYILHLILTFYCVYVDMFPTWLFVILFVISRTSQAAIGHYHLHRAKNGIADWGEFMFDNQYLGAAYVVFDGHVLLHHFYTTSGADIKKTVFTGVLAMPRLLRIPLFSLRRFGIVQFGMFLKVLYFFKQQYWDGLTGMEFGMMPWMKKFEFFFFRGVLMSEFWWFYYTGHT